MTPIPFTEAMDAEFRAFLRLTTGKEGLGPAHRAEVYRRLRAMEPPSPDAGGRSIPISAGPPSDPTCPPSLGIQPPAIPRFDRVLGDMERRCGALLEAARRVGFGNMNAFYSTRDGAADLIINLNIRIRVDGTEDMPA